MRYRVVHRTSYHYDGVVAAGYNEAHLLPRSSARQVVTAAELAVDPTPTDARERDDAFGNRVSLFATDTPHDHLEVIATSTVEVHEPEFLADGWVPWEERRASLLRLRDDEAMGARQYLLDSPLVTTNSTLAAYAFGSFTPGRPLVEATIDLMGRIHWDFAYDPTATTLATPLDQVMAERRGVCQDFAHVMVGCLRSVGLPARYVSGYLETLPPPGEAKLLGADASHAWASLWVPGLGWLDLDPTNNQTPDSRYVMVGWGRDFSDVTPLKGVAVSPGVGWSLEVAVDVHRLEQ